MQDQFKKGRLGLLLILESNYVVNSAIPIKIPKYFTETLILLYQQYWKEIVFKYYNQNSNILLYSISFPK